MQSDPRLGDFLALDPGLRSTGVAVFRCGQLYAADAIQIDKDDDETPVARCLRMGQEIFEWLGNTGARPRILAVEWPGKSWRGDARDLHGLCGVDGVVAGSLWFAAANAGRALEVVSYEVGEWSGDIPKATTKRGAKSSPRALRVLARLKGEELDVWESVTVHDTIDAIGLGLHLLGRFDPVRVFPGATKRRAK